MDIEKFKIWKKLTQNYERRSAGEIKAKNPPAIIKTDRGYIEIFANVSTKTNKF